MKKYYTVDGTESFKTISLIAFPEYKAEIGMHSTNYIVPEFEGDDPALNEHLKRVDLLVSAVENVIEHWWD